MHKLGRFQRTIVDRGGSLPKPRSGPASPGRPPNLPRLRFWLGHMGISEPSLVIASASKDGACRQV